MDRRGPILIAVLAVGALVGGAVSLHDSRPHRARAAPRPHAAQQISASAAVRRNARADALAVAGLLRHPRAIRAGTSHRREVALTFDDGPSPYSRRVVATLRR